MTGNYLVENHTNLRALTHNERERLETCASRLNRIRKRDHGEDDLNPARLCQDIKELLLIIGGPTAEEVKEF